MDQWQALVMTCIVGAIAYLFLAYSKQSSKLGSIETMLGQIVQNQAEMREQIAEDKHEMKEAQDAIKLQQQAIDHKLNTFLKSEIDTLKDLASFVRNKG
jgi:transcription termination factor NusB